MQTIRKQRIENNSSTKNHDVNFKELYDKVFEVRKAITPEDIAASHKIRYQVYCVENNYEDPANNPGEQEIDHFDEHSIHSILIHRQSGLVVGSVRIVLPQKDNIENCLPIQEICNLKELDNEYNPLVTGEISRFCISKQMRKRVYDNSQYGGISNPDEITDENSDNLITKRMIPYAAMGLIKSVLEIGAENNIHSLYASMEPFLIRSLGMLGIPSTKMGGLVEYHGIRQPTKLSAIDVYRQSKKINYNTWQIISNNGELHKKEEIAMSRQFKRKFAAA